MLVEAEKKEKIIWLLLTFLKDTDNLFCRISLKFGLSDVSS